MNEGTVIIIVGLVLDIVGALLIIGPIRHSKNMIKRLMESWKETGKFLQDRKEGKPEEITPQTNKIRIDKLETDRNKRLIEELKDYIKVILGIVLLVVGFILQIIGNWIQNPPI